MVVKLFEFMSARHAALPVKNFPVARQSDPSPPTEVNNPASAINLKKMVTQQSKYWFWSKIRRIGHFVG